MATKRWIGGATAVAQVDTLTVGGTIEAGDKFLIAVTGEDGGTYTLTVSASGTTIAGTCTDIATAWNASANPLLTPITALAGSTTVTLTADSAGIPFVVSVSTTESDNSGADGQTFSRAATTANIGPNDWSSANNWSDYAVPVSTDTVVIDGRSAVSILNGLNQSSVTLAKLQIVKGTLAIGSTSGPLRISATILDINTAPTDGSKPSGASTINIDTGSNATTCTVYDSNTQGVNGLEPVIWKGAHASNIVRVLGGRVGIAASKPGDTATLPTLQVLGDSNTSVHVGSGATLTNVTVTGGDVLLECGATTVNQDGGTITTAGTGAITTVYAGGTFTSNSTGTITTMTVENQGNLVLTGTLAARTITNCTVSGPNAKISAALPVTSGAAFPVTFTNGVDCLNGATSKQVDLGGDITVTPSAIG